MDVLLRFKARIAVMAIKISESRRYPRRKLDISAEIMPGKQLCKVLNISHEGAQLVVGETAALPKTFELHLKSDGSVIRHCKLVWVRGTNVGVSFY